MSRLIDADALVETLADQIKANESDTSASGMAAKEVLKGFIGLVNGQPTASDWDRYSKKLWKEAYERGKRDGQSSAQPNLQPTCNQLATDCISRQAAIDALRKEMPGGCSGKAEYIIEQLPTAQPELSQIARDIATIIENEQDMRVILSAQPKERTEERTETHACDCISRQAAIAAIEHRLTEPAYQHTGEDWYVGMNCAESELYDLPSAQPQRMRGRWVPVTNGRGGFECDQCHNYAPSYQNGVEWLSDFCPNCGTQMDGGES